MKSGISIPGQLESKTVHSAGMMRMSTLCGCLVQQRGLVQGLKTMRKELIQPAARSTDPAVGGQQAVSSG